MLHRKSDRCLQPGREKSWQGPPNKRNVFPDLLLNYKSIRTFKLLCRSKYSEAEAVLRIQAKSYYEFYDQSDGDTTYTENPLRITNLLADALQRPKKTRRQ